MKAVIYEQYGSADVLHLQELEKPVPKNDEVLIHTYATSVTAGDWRLRKADPFLARIFNGLFRPKRVNILGFELAGVIEEVGKGVQSFKVGDPVFAFCSLKFGGYAEYCCLQEKDVIALKPDNISFEEAATFPLGALTALAFLRKGGIQTGHKILIYGASGSVGTFAVQLAKHFGAEVTGVCSAKIIAFVQSLGAHEVLDYTQENFTLAPNSFDLIFDAVGKIQKSVVKQGLKTKGKFVSVTGQVNPPKADLWFIKGLIETGKLTTVIDRTYNLSEIQAAHRYVEQFRKRGNVAVRVV